MALETPGLFNMVLPDGRNSLGNLLHTPTTPQSHMFGQNTSLLSDRTHILPDSSPINILSSPIELQLSRVSADQLLSSGNSAYLQAQLLIERQQRKIGEMENQIRGLEKDLVEWKTRGTTAEATVNMLILSIPKPVVATNSLPISKDIPPPLDPKDYPNVRFWTLKAFKAHCDKEMGETDVLETTKEKRGPGRRRKDEEDDDFYPYLENADGTPVPWELIVKIGQKARRVWRSLHNVGQAPSSWGKASETAYTYFISEMLNIPELEFFRYCEGNWKIMRWATKAYSSWTKNYLKPKGAKTAGVNKRKRELLDDPSLLQIDDDVTAQSLEPCTIQAASTSEAARTPLAPTSGASPIQAASTSEAARTPLAPTSGPSPIQTVSTSASPRTPPAPTLVPAQQPTMDFVDPLDELYNDAEWNDAHGTTLPSATPKSNASATPSAPTATIPPSVTATSSEKENLASTSNGSPVPLASASNAEAAGQSQAPVKRAKGLAVVGTGLTDKNFCMKDWLLENPNGSKDAFEKYFKALPADVKKIYKDRANAAKAARKGKKTGPDTMQSGTQCAQHLAQESQVA